MIQDPVQRQEKAPELAVGGDQAISPKQATHQAQSTRQIPATGKVQATGEVKGIEEVLGDKSPDKGWDNNLDKGGDPVNNQNKAKQQAAVAAADLIEAGMKVGLGTGSTADYFVDRLGERVAGGLAIVGVPTSVRTAERAKARGIPLASLDELGRLDLVVDGADEVDGDLRLIKGAGGALLREKIVAAASDDMLVIADPSKIVQTLGAFPLPIEISPFGAASILRAIEKTAAQLGLTGALVMRQTKADALYVTDGQHYIVDGHFHAITDAERLSAALKAIVGVVDHGLFLNMASTVYVGDPAGLRILQRRP